MSTPPSVPPRCRHCSAILQPPGHVCASCGQPQQVVQHFAPPPMIAPKSTGVAAILSILWMGAGHLYAGRNIAVGICFLLWDFCLVLLSLTGIGMILSIPLWFITMPIALITSMNDVKAQNAKFGIISA